MARDGRLRLFLALRIPDGAVDSLAAWQARELRGRVVARDNLHATLAFLGSRPAVELPSILDVLGRAARGARPAALEVTGYRETRSVGMLVAADEDARAAALAGDLGARLERLAVYRPEKRPWLPHVTVLRFRDRPRLDPPVPDLGPVRLSEAAVYHSVLRPSGAQYEVLESVPLGG